MTSGSGGSGPGAAPARGRRASLPLVVGLVVVGALAAAALVIVSATWIGRDALTAAAFAVVAVVYDVVARRVERVRRLTNAGPYVNMSSVWLFACAVALPTVWVVLLTFVVYAYLEVQSRIDGTRRPWYRVAFNTGVALLSFIVASGVFDTVSAPAGTGVTSSFWHILGVAAAIATVLGLSTLLVGVAIALSQPGVGIAALVGGWSSNLLELATLSIGALVGLVVPVDIWLCLLAVPAMASLQRSAMVDQLESAASNDAKTGLLNSAAWQALAERELVRCEARGRTAAVMVIDLDHFKRVNDTYGHLTGDAVLRAVADCMGDMLRDRDLLARFGGEEFVALLVDADAHEALRVAERLRMRIADVVVTQVGDPPQAVLTAGDPLEGETFTSGADQIKVTVSAGLASFPEHGTTVDTLLEKADRALYAAKHAGRNQVHVSAPAA